MPELLLSLTLILNVCADFADRCSTSRASALTVSFWASICQLLLMLPFIGLVGSFPISHIFLCLVVAIVSAAGRILWYRALAESTESLATLAPFLRLSSVFVVLFAFLILHEPFTVMKIAGTLLIILGSALVTLDQPKRSIAALLTNNRAVLLVLIFAISMSTVTVLYKYLLNAGAQIWTAYFYLKGFQAAFLLILASQRPVNKSGFFDAHDARLFLFARVLQTSAAVIYLTALRNADLSSVEPIMALAPFIYLFIEKIAPGFARLHPRLSTTATPVHKSLTGPRLAAIAIVMIGSFLMYLQ
ncbi:MAG: EamA family transporter [Chthoniobacterales bacterium]